ncbi:hypothetical protein RD792_005266 [Penstemon davidsonii]|uniref:Uncharacterized protein n=1 Tax=Penstemon davidsonii TaxID=160366 RepID=A0ABR0DJV8_9LAMI|nr:hypothetical protein RD792_005266 [Penstemon davidsonii]
MAQVGSAIAGLMVAYAMYRNYFPHELLGPVKRYAQKSFSYFYPYLEITIPEYQGEYGFIRSKVFAAVERYLNEKSTKQAQRLQANVTRDSDTIVLTMANQEQVTDEYKGIKLWWASKLTTPNQQSITFYPREDEKRHFNLTFHKRYRDIIIDNYMKHVLDEGKAITIKERQRKLFINNKSENWNIYRQGMWSHVVFEHPATFDTLAMDPLKKQEIIDDLMTFSNAKDYYAKVGKTWKRGYLLYGPPGTGKSTMIAAMANLLKYDIYDLELTAVKDNTELKKLLINTSSKSIVVIEDIDCSLDLTGQREKKNKKKDEENDPIKEDKLDPALIRRGRMDKHIELSYCGFEAFKAFAKKYLDIDSHDLFVEVRRLLDETKMTPADVAENLMPKWNGEDEESCLMRLVKALEEAEEEEKRKVEEEKKAKAKEEEEKKKEEENGVAE